MKKLRVIDGSMEEYDPTEFRIPASDTKGHSARQWFRCVPAMARVIEQTIQEKIFPYRTKGDLLRHALHRHMKWLSSVGSVKSVSGQVDAILEIMRDEQMNDDFSAVFSKLKERIDQHLGEGSRGEAVRLVLLVNSHVEGMPSGFWKTRYKKKIMDDYGGLLKGANKARLGDIND